MHYRHSFNPEYIWSIRFDCIIAIIPFFRKETTTLWRIIKIYMFYNEEILCSLEM